MLHWWKRIGAYIVIAYLKRKKKWSRILECANSSRSTSPIYLPSIFEYWQPRRCNSIFIMVSNHNQRFWIQRWYDEKGYLDACFIICVKRDKAMRFFYLINLNRFSELTEKYYSSTLWSKTLYTYVHSFFFLFRSNKGSWHYKRKERKII